MTDITDRTTSLPPAVARFVLHWGEMGAVWGTNRSVGQIHALLYLSDRPLTAEDLAGTLGLARSNVSNSLKELQAWNLIRRVHVMGDRRDYFAAEADLWEMVTRIAEGRKTREIDPTLATLKACVAEADADRFMSDTARRRIAEMHDFVSAVDVWAGQMRRVPRSKLATLMRLGAAIVRYIPGRAAHKPEEVPEPVVEDASRPPGRAPP
jgi:DNA-binding transcriptional regulator GbsR (MarR family)